MSPNKGINNFFIFIFLYIDNNIYNVFNILGGVCMYIYIHYDQFS